MTNSEIRFSSNKEFYEFVDLLRENLKQLDFCESADALNQILHEIAWTTSSEPFGEIRRVLETLKKTEGKRLPPCLLEDVDVCVRTIKQAWLRANNQKA